MERQLGARPRAWCRCHLAGTGSDGVAARFGAARKKKKISIFLPSPKSTESRAAAQPPRAAVALWDYSSVKL